MYLMKLSCVFPAAFFQDLADRAMKEMQVMIHTLARKGTTTALRTKVRLT